MLAAVGLYNHRGEMAAGQLWNNSGDLCRCGSRRGKLFIPFSYEGFLHDER